MKPGELESRHVWSGLAGISAAIHAEARPEASYRHFTLIISGEIPILLLRRAAYLLAQMNSLVTIEIGSLHNFPRSSDGALV